MPPSPSLQPLHDAGARPAGQPRPRGLAFAILAVVALAIVGFPGLGPSTLSAQLPKILSPQGTTGSEAEDLAQSSPEAEEESNPLDLQEVVAGDPLEADTWKRLADRMLDGLIDFLPDLLYAFIILAVFAILYQGASRLLEGVLRRTSADPALREITVKIARIVFVGFGLVMAAGQLGFEIGSLLAGIGVLGLAVGLAAQDTLANFIAGLTILWDRPFRIGDNVTIAETFGTVEKIGLRSTRIRTVDERDAVLPNKEVINQKIINHTLSPRLRLDIPLGIAYKEDSRHAREELLAAVEGHPRILEAPEPRVVVVGLGDSSVNLELRVWLREPHEERAALTELVELAKITLDTAGIEIPFPQRTLHFAEGPPPRASEAERLRAAREVAGGAVEKGED